MKTLRDTVMISVMISEREITASSILCSVEYFVKKSVWDSTGFFVWRYSGGNPVLRDCVKDFTKEKVNEDSKGS